MMRPAWISERRRRLVLHHQYASPPESVAEESHEAPSVPESEMPQPPALRPAICLKILGLSDQPRRVNVNRPFLVMGRESACDVRLDHESVSPRHAYFQFIADRILLIDLQSATGTRWNGEPRFCDWVGDEDSISIGPYLLGLTDDREPTASVPPNFPIGPPAGITAFTPRGYVLRPLTDDARTASAVPLKFGGMVTLVGSSPRCAIRLEHPSIAEFHCSLIQTADGLQIVDLLSGCRTAVNGAPVRSADLEQGNELQLGEIWFRLMHDDAEPDPDDVTLWAVPETVSKIGEARPADSSTRELRLSSATPHPAGMTHSAANGNGFASKAPSGPYLAPQSAYNLAAQETLQGALSVLATLESRLGDLCQQMAAVQHEIEKLREQIAPVQSVAAELQEFMQRLKWMLDDPQPMPISRRPRRRTVPQLKSSLSRRTLASPRSEGPSNPPAKTESPYDPLSPTDVDAHVWLFNRIARIHRERNSRWRQVFDLFT